MRSKLVLGIADGWLSADGQSFTRRADIKSLFSRRSIAAEGAYQARAPEECTARVLVVAQMGANQRYSAGFSEDVRP